MGREHTGGNFSGQTEHIHCIGQGPVGGVRTACARNGAEAGARRFGSVGRGQNHGGGFPSSTLASSPKRLPPRVDKSAPKPRRLRTSIQSDVDINRGGGEFLGRPIPVLGSRFFTSRPRRIWKLRYCIPWRTVLCTLNSSHGCPWMQILHDSTQAYLESHRSPIVFPEIQNVATPLADFHLATFLFAGMAIRLLWLRRL